MKIAEWTEVYDGCLCDKKPNRVTGRYGVYLLLNRCVVIDRRGKKILQRTFDCVSFDSGSESAAWEEAEKFIQRDDVRMLDPRYRINEPARLDKREPATDSLIKGTDPIYAEKP